MTTAADRIVGLNGFTAWKPPVRAATTADITLSGEQTIDGVAVVANDRVLVKDQTTGSDNGIWIAATGAWTRAADFNGARDVVSGTSVMIFSGTANGKSLWHLTNTGVISIGATALTFGEIMPLRGQVYASEFGSGATGINDAIDYANGVGGGTVFVLGDTTVSAQIVLKDKVRLCIIAGSTITLDTDLGSSAMVYGSDVPDAQVCGGGTLDPAGLTTGYALEIEGASNYPVNGLIVTEHKAGVRIEANATSGIGDCVIRDLKVYDNFVHPTSPATLSQAGHGLSISCRPSLGYDLTESVSLYNVHLAGVATGATDGSNQYTKDLLSIQGAKRVWADGVVSKRSGEVGLSFTFGCRNVTLQNALVEEADGHGIIFSGAHYRLDISGASGPFQVGETVTGGTSGATGVIEYLFADHMWIETPSVAKMAAAETITGGTSLETATVDASWYAFNCKSLPSVTTKGNGIDVDTVADYAGLTAQHVVGALLGGTHGGNKPWAMNSNGSNFMTLENYCPLDAVQTSRLQVAGSSVYLGEGIGTSRIEAPEDASGIGDSNDSWFFTANRQMAGSASEDAPLLLNRTGAAGTETGNLIELRENGVALGAIGNDGLQLPGTSLTVSYGHASLPAAAGAVRKLNISTDSRGGSLALLRSDATDHIDVVTGLPSRTTAWTKTTIEAETGAITGGATYTSDGADDHPALSIWNGSSFDHLPLQPPAETATIADTASTEAVSFGTTRANADYSVGLTPHGDENVWITSVATTGFTINRAGTSGALDVDWIVVPHANP